ncbi:MAG: hypothetical protein WDZ26_03580 [Nitriliruptoraceae bacterium]
MNRRAVVVTACLAVLAVVVDLLVGSSHVPGYSAAIGLFGCIVIVLVSRWLGAVLIQRPEDHWPDDVPADEQGDLRG